MRFIDPMSITCPSCEGIGRYSTDDLLALHARCQHCWASLESVGLKMKALMRALSTAQVVYFAKLEVAIELERLFEVDLDHVDFDRLWRPSDLAQFLPGSATQECRDRILEALALVKRVPVGPSDLERSFDELFSFREEGQRAPSN